MIPLTARAALSQQVVRAAAEERPRLLPEESGEAVIYAVFAGEQGAAAEGAFLGLVTEREIACSPQRIFADLLPEPRPGAVAPDASLQDIASRMEAEAWEAVPVLDAAGALQGVVTRTSLLTALLRHERESVEELQRLEARQRRMIARLEELQVAGVGLLRLLGGDPLEKDLLQRALEALTTLLGARYGALGLLDDAGRLRDFLYVGMGSEQIERIGRLPEGRGLLGTVVKENTVLRLDDLSRDPRAVGFPPHHPPMKTLLALPIGAAGRIVGRVYLCDKEAGEPFTVEDERVGLVFSHTVGLFLENMRARAERDRALEARCRSEARLVEAQRLAHIDTWEFDLITGELFCSEDLRRLGRMPERVTKNPIGTFLRAVHPEDRKRVAKLIRGAVAHGKPYSVDHRLLPPDGAERVVHSQGEVIRDEAGRVIRILGTVQDITARKQTERELERAQQAAEAADGAKSEFLANVSHEMRTPLNVILGMTEMGLDTELTAEQREYLEAVQASGRSLLSLIEGVLDVAVIEAGRVVLDAVDFGLRGCVDGAVRGLGLPAHKKSLELAYQVAPDVPDALVGDPKRLRQIVSNLVHNAVKFTEHGEVVVRVEVESRTESGVCVHATVTDTGIGIPAEKQGVIFERFVQADGSMTRRYGGTGLGLSIVADLVEMMGGRVWVESEPGRGSTFHFTARLGLQEGAPPTRLPQIPALRDLSVLVVDDNATSGRIVAEMLAAWQLRPTLVDSGESALAALNAAAAAGAPFDLVLLDASIPEMDGFALAEWIRQRPGSAAGASVMMLPPTSHFGDVAHCRKLGVDAYVRKPVAETDLWEALGRALSIARWDEDRPVLSSGARRRGAATGSISS